MQIINNEKKQHNSVVNLYTWDKVAERTEEVYKNASNGTDLAGVLLVIAQKDGLCSWFWMSLLYVTCALLYFIFAIFLCPGRSTYSSLNRSSLY